MAAHKHAAVIHAYADGQEIQIFKNGEWVDLDEPVRFFQGVDYRIKPAEPERVYPVTSMNHTDLEKAYGSGIYTERAEEQAKRICNAALKHACDAGEIVTREEFDRAVEDLKSQHLIIARAIVEEFYEDCSKVTDADLLEILSSLK